tara:strand:+ start:1892 stop:2365 length:474 start_codon:yes stop_codon:yes gene_type:complete
VKSDFPTFVKGVLTPKIGKTAKLINIMMQTHFNVKGIPLTKEQFVVLLCLEGEVKTQSFLTLITERDKGSLTRLIQSLERKKYVIRRVSEEDNRVNEVELTPKGSEILESTKPMMKNLFTLLQEGIDKNEIEVVSRVMEKMQCNAMKEIERIEEVKN